MSVSLLPREFPVEADAQVLARPASQPLRVLKFGSSVLRTIADLPVAAGEVYRQRRKGYRIVAVVSALADETDRLFGEAALVSDSVSCSGTAELVSLGEDRTAALLRIACDRIGLPAAICRPEELGLLAAGNELDADFDQLRPFSLLRKLDEHGVVIVPGFVGVGAHGERKLLGRGGSDFTAAILGGELGAETVRLYKDVDGVFERDPAVDPAARKFEEVGYEDALRVASRLVHAKALEFAAGKALTIEVERIGSSAPTRIGGTRRVAGATDAPATLRVAIAGYGNVGQALVRRLAGDPHFEIVSILVRDAGRCRGFPAPIAPTDDLTAFAGVKADAIVEVLSCQATGGALCAASLRNGVSVVTASKRLVSEKLVDLGAAAQAGNASLLHSAAVGGSAPVLEAIDRERASGAIECFRGILNGTVNFILDRLAEGVSFDTALGLARVAGFTEEDCEADLSGADAAAKLRLIAHRAFGVMPQDVTVACRRLDEDLAATIQASGERWVQLSEVSHDGGLSAHVRIVPASEAGIWTAPDEWNVGVIYRRDGREVSVRGRGAGGPATAEAVLADLYDLLEARSSQRPAKAPVEGLSSSG